MLLLCCWGRNVPVESSKHHSCSWPGALRHQLINSSSFCIATGGGGGGSTARIILVSSSDRNDFVILKRLGRKDSAIAGNHFAFLDGDCGTMIVIIFFSWELIELDIHGEILHGIIDAYHKHEAVILMYFISSHHVFPEVHSLEWRLPIMIPRPCTSCAMCCDTSAT